jgi:hypothetical protein
MWFSFLQDHRETDHYFQLQEFSLWNMTVDSSSHLVFTLSVYPKSTFHFIRNLPTEEVMFIYRRMKKGQSWGIEMSL